MEGELKVFRIVLGGFLDRGSAFLCGYLYICTQMSH